MAAGFHGIEGGAKVAQIVRGRAFGGPRCQLRFDDKPCLHEFGERDTVDNDHELERSAQDTGCIAGEIGAIADALGENPYGLQSFQSLPQGTAMDAKSLCQFPLRGESRAKRQAAI